MTTTEVSNKYHDLAKQNKWHEIIDTLYDNDITCIEPASSRSSPITKGKRSSKKKSRTF